MVMTLLSVLPRDLPTEGIKVSERGRETLADYVRRVRRSQNLSCMDVESRSARHGPKIGASYVSRIENSIATNPSRAKLVALAHGLGRPAEEVFAAARGQALSAPSVQEDMLLRLFRELPAERREDFLATLRAVHDLRVSPSKKKPGRAA